MSLAGTCRVGKILQTSWPDRCKGPAAGAGDHHLLGLPPFTGWGKPGHL